MLKISSFHESYLLPLFPPPEALTSVRVLGLSPSSPILWKQRKIAHMKNDRLHLMLQQVYTTKKSFYKRTYNLKNETQQRVKVSIRFCASSIQFKKTNSQISGSQTFLERGALNFSGVPRSSPQSKLWQSLSKIMKYQ